MVLKNFFFISFLGKKFLHFIQFEENNENEKKNKTEKWIKMNKIKKNKENQINKYLPYKNVNVLCAIFIDMNIRGCWLVVVVDVCLK